MTERSPTFPERLVRTILALGLLLAPTSTLACTLCHSLPALTIRARILGPDLSWNVAAMLLPLFLLGAIVAIVCYEPDRGAGA